MKRAILFISILALISSCGKYKYKRDCCTGSMTIFTDNFNNSDSVYFAAPNAFTPNGDGINDFFKLYVNGVDMTTATLSIRKANSSFIDGTEVFNGYEGDITWDGMYKGNVSDPGKYSYEFSAMTFDNQIIEGEGEFCLIEYDYTSGIKNCSSCYFGDQFEPREHTFTLPTHETYCDQ